MSPRGRRSKSKRGTKRPAAEPLPKFGSLKEQEAFYASHDFSALFDAGEEVESNAAPTGRLRGRKPQVKTERGTREMRLLVPMQLAEQVRAAASSAGRSVSNWLLGLVKQKLAMDHTALWSLQPGETAPVLGSDGKRSAAFIHVKVSNLGEFTPRVRGWVRFCDLEGREVCAGEMPIRWSSRPEPLMLFPVTTSPSIEFRWIPNPVLLPDGYFTDFAAGEEQAFAFAIKMQDGSCWGWTQESYWHGWRHPVWKLPVGRIRIFVRLQAAGKEWRADFELNTEDHVDSIVVRASHGSAGVQGEAASAHLPSEDLPENVIKLFRAG